MNRVKVQIHGAVQGVGFRPFVYRLATELGLKGWVINSSEGVFIDAEGTDENIESFLLKLKTDRPKQSFIQSFEHTFLDPTGFTEFVIKESDGTGSKTALVLPDIAACNDCIDEIFDPANRRYLYPFTNCTNCGPRFSIIRALPYDRKNTAMDEFEMCDNCRAEYTNPLNRRFHAEPTACPKCGPQATLADSKGIVIADKNDAINKTASLIKDGRIIALKGIGGYQLLADASNADAIKELRKRKHRSEKPFALMFPDIESIESVCEVTEAEKNLLLSSEAPIVLLKRKPQNTSGEQIVAYEAAGLNPNLGVMLPYTPLHHILMSYLKIPVIATSGNISEEPICIDDAEAFEKLSSIADYFLTNNRKILRHVDDSIVRIAAGREYMMRRARGYAPLPLVVEGIKSPALAVGPHLKNTVAINNGSNVFVSQHIGDLENAEAINAFERVISDFESFYEVKPEAVVCDMHPDYVSTKYAKGTGLPVHSVQHHYAHVLSCMAENELSGEVLGVSWDGTGYGIDGTIWGGEFLVPQGRQFRRAGHLRSFKIPGGDKAIHQVWRLGLAVLYETFGIAAFEKREIGLIASAKPGELRIIQQMIDSGLNSPMTTSAGRLFDAVSAIIGLKHEANFEAQAAMELEFMAEQIETNDYYDFDVIESGGSFIADWRIIVSKLVEDICAGTPKPLMAAKFHNSLAEMIIRVAQLLGINKVVLTGGCFLNKYLLERTISRLRQKGFSPYWHQRVPAGDGGISLGQIKYMTYL